jgi:hypothetical protein
MDSEKGAFDIFSQGLVFAAGSAIIALSAGVGMSYAFRYDYAVVYLSFVGFILGYRVAQIGYHNGKESYLVFLKDVWRLKDHKINVISFLGGSLFASLGFILLGKAVSAMSLTLGLSAGAVIGGGYILSHWAVNNRLV